MEGLEIKVSLVTSAATKEIFEPPYVGCYEVKKL